MSFWGRLFGTDKAIEKTITAAGRVIDDAWYTDEEKADARADARRDAQSMVIEWMQNTQGQNLSRRLIALSITGSWLGMHLLSTTMACAAIWSGKAVQLKASSALIDTRLDGMTGAVMLILGFYFALPYMKDITKSALDRFGKPNAVS